MRNFVPVGCGETMLLIATALLLTCPGFSGSTVSPALAKEKSELNNVIVEHGAMYVVAVNGSDKGPGTPALPWATINHAAEQAEAGDTVVVRGGYYVLSAQVRPSNSGRSDAWITFIGYPGEKPILDADLVPRSSLFQGGLDNGAFQIEGVSHVRVANLTVINSRDAGFTVRDSSNIDLINNSTEGTFSSGIAVWDTSHEGKRTAHIRILGNTITKATTWDLAPPDVPRRGVAQQEALSIGGAVDFEVAYNHVYGSDQEGIDIKETSKRGKVHHNLANNVGGQGIYIDAWFGTLSDIEVYSNVIHDCKAGLILSVENGKSVEKVKIHNNLVFNNVGSGLLFSRWGVDNTRWNVEIYNNVFYHNGHGRPSAGQAYYWITGGLYLYSANVREISISKNIFADNRGFQIGYSELFLKGSRSWQAVAREKQIKIVGNLVDGSNTIESPIQSGGAPSDRVNIYAVAGDQPIFGDPLFKDPANQDFSLRRGSPAALGRYAGAYAPGQSSKLWWKQAFPPGLVRARYRSKAGKATIAVHLQASP
jgi:parallel beta-helix repeat protein